jgi:hypothetical protein
MNLSKIELYGTTGTVIRYVEEGSNLIFTSLDARQTGMVENVAIDGKHAAADRVARIADRVARQGHIVTCENLKYPLKLGFYGMRQR